MRIPGLHIASELDALPWRDTRVPGVEWIDLAEGDNEGGAMTVLIRMAPGYGYPRHRHTGPEDVLVLAGGYRDDDGRTVRAGDFVRYPGGSEHTPVALGDRDAPVGDSNPACVLYAVAHGGTERVDPLRSPEGESHR